MRTARHAAMGVLLALLVSVSAVVMMRAGATSTAPASLPTPKGLVSDFAGVIDPATAAALTARLEELKRATGAEIAVVTVRSTAPETTFDYAMRIAEAWKPGAPGKDNGVVFLVAVDDRDMFIATGYGIEGALPDGLVGEIRDRDILPRFRAGDMAGGIRAGVERMAAIIAREYGATLAPAPAPSPQRGTPIPAIAAFALVLLLAFVIFVLPPLLAASQPGRRRRGGWGTGPMWGGSFGGGGFGGSGGGFGGSSGGFDFGGGSFGGGGAGGKW